MLPSRIVSSSSKSSSSKSIPVFILHQRIVSFSIFASAFSLLSILGCCPAFLHYIFPLICPNQELKIEGEQIEALEEDNLDLMLLTKKKKPKKVDFEEGETFEKDDGENELSSLLIN